MKSSFSEVTEAQKYRRKLGGNTDANRMPRESGAVLKIIKHQAMTNLVGQYGNQATFALGVAHLPQGDAVVVAYKGVGPTMRDTVETAVKTASGHCFPQAKIIDVGSIPDGLHSEMAIVKYVKQNSSYAKHNLYNFLQIACVGKPVCLDCAGWLNKHFIGHCSLLPDTNVGAAISFASVKPSKMGGGIWTNPLSDAVYNGAPEVQSYRKGNLSLSTYGH